MIVENVKNTASEMSTLSHIHNWLIKKLVGKKAVCINMALGYSYTGLVEAQPKDKNGMYVVNCTFPPDQIFMGK